MTAKTILILGGSEFQVPLIQAAKQLGLYVITCDYLPDNPGHALADKYLNVSTTDKDAVLQVAIDHKIDSIATFASDPAIPTIGYVVEHLGLPGISARAAESFSHKSLFRQVLKQAGLKTPSFYLTESASIPLGLHDKKPYIVKPVDSSGSKGVRLSTGTQSNIVECIKYALSFSRSHRCIIEEYLEGPQVHGDGFLQDGKLIAGYFGDQYFYTQSDSFIPISTRWPTVHADIHQQLKRQLEQLAAHTGYLNGPINVEARLNRDNELYLIEVGARNGGNFVPLLQQRLTGFDYVDAVLKTSLGQQVMHNEACQQTQRKIGAYYVLHAQTDGIFAGINIDSSLEPYIFYKKLFKEKGEAVQQYCGSHTSIGVLLLAFPTVESRDQQMDEIAGLVKVLYA
ncbi:ATP-grasp domain-containing protein [Psychrobacter sp. 1Y11]|uniref:ATP-grasp domain-containing protein n=1 Tax=Psychrobacter sp. 1Y11 TaxID=3457446 RepID=UPI003FD60488